MCFYCLLKELNGISSLYIFCTFVEILDKPNESKIIREYTWEYEYSTGLGLIDGYEISIPIGKHRRMNKGQESNSLVENDAVYLKLSVRKKTPLFLRRLYKTYVNIPCNGSV